MSKQDANIDLRVSCDACVARAVYCIRFTFGTIFMCGHHWKANEKAISSHEAFRDTSLMDGSVLLAKLIFSN